MLKIVLLKSKLYIKRYYNLANAPHFTILTKKYQNHIYFFLNRTIQISCFIRYRRNNITN